MTAQIKIFTSDVGRKRKYVGIIKDSVAYPVVYFRKSKFSTNEEFELLIKHIMDNL